MAFSPSAKVLRAAAQQQDVGNGRSGSRLRQPVPEIAASQGRDVPQAAEIFEKEKVSTWAACGCGSSVSFGHTRGDTVAFVRATACCFRRTWRLKGYFPAFATPQSRSDTGYETDELERLKPRIVVGAHYDVTDASTIAAYRSYLTTLRARVGELRSRQVGGRDGRATARGVQGQVSGLGETDTDTRRSHENLRRAPLMMRDEG